eukprot:3917911-Prymnesium_polylepis.1
MEPVAARWVQRRTFCLYRWVGTGARMVQHAAEKVTHLVAQRELVAHVRSPHCVARVRAIPTEK